MGRGRVGEWGGGDEEARFVWLLYLHDEQWRRGQRVESSRIDVEKTPASVPHRCC